MKHYEIVLMFDPNKSDKIDSIIEKYRNMITTKHTDTYGSEVAGSIHRYEDWGRRVLAYPINKINKANYILMNVECASKIINELEQLLRYNDAVLRYLILNMASAETGQSEFFAQDQDEVELPVAEIADLDAADLVVEADADASLA